MCLFGSCRRIVSLGSHWLVKVHPIFQIPHSFCFCPCALFSVICKHMLSNSGGFRCLSVSSQWVWLSSAWMSSEGFLNEFWIRSEWVLRGFRMRSRWFLNEFWMSSGWNLKTFCKNEIWMNLQSMWLNSVWMKSEWVLRAAVSFAILMWRTVKFQFGVWRETGYSLGSLLREGSLAEGSTLSSFWRFLRLPWSSPVCGDVVHSAVI